MIKRFRVRNYKALRDVTLDLTPIHVLIGPNDSGKTSILEAVEALCRSADQELKAAFTGRWEGTQLVWRGESDQHVEFQAWLPQGQEEWLYELACGFAPVERRVQVRREVIRSGTQTIDCTHDGMQASSIYRVGAHGQIVPEPKRAPNELSLRTAVKAVHACLAGVQSYRWVPGDLALPVAPDSSSRFRMEPSGFGLARCLDDILGYDRNKFTKLEDRFRGVFPHVKSIKLVPEAAFRSPPDNPKGVLLLGKADGKGIHFEFSNSRQPIPASQVSDGMLLVLAYLAVLYLPEPPRVLLVEEPENGVHPKRLETVLQIVRDLVEEQTHTQVLLTTHSPYVVDLFKPEEVTLCQVGDDGAVSVHRLSGNESVRKQLSVFTLGEIWTAEGDEALARSCSPEEEPER